MSRLDDLIDLIQTANEIYLINPDRNVRTAYIQIDDLCELTMKSYLQLNMEGWSPTGTNGYYKGFHIIDQEIRNQFSSNQPLMDLLDRFVERRGNRNHFFHNHMQTGLTVTPENGLMAFCDLYEIMAILFPAPQGFQEKLQTKPILKTQTAVIRLRRESCQHPGLRNRYDGVLQKIENENGGKRLRKYGELFVPYGSFAYEYCIINLYATPLYRALEEAGLIF